VIRPKIQRIIFAVSEQSCGIADTYAWYLDNVAEKERESIA